MTNIVMITTLTNLRFMCQPEVQLFADGTFKYCAKFFYQMYTIHAYKNEQYVHCAYFLLPCKSRECYIQMFQHLIDACTENELSLNPSCLHLDFEISVHEAAKHFCPNVSVKACQFHLSKAWYRKIQSLGLAKEYKDKESPTGDWLKVFFGLSFLEPVEVEECFVFDLFSVAPDCEKAVKFADYVLKTYVCSDSAVFPPQIWAESNIEGIRTTNGCESFHNQFGSMFYSTHPNIFDFLEKIKCTQTKTYLKIRATKTPVLLAKRDREIVQKKRELQDQYKNGQLSRVEYVKQMTFKVLSPS